MKLSYYFEDLSRAYKAEIEDLQSDSEGKNVLRARLMEKRREFPALMSMIEFAPEMVVPAFHGGVRFIDPHAMTHLSSLEPDEFPSWDAIEEAVRFEPWGDELALIALGEPDGERFMSTVVCLEYLLEKCSDKPGSRPVAASDDEAEQDDQEQGEDRDGDDEDSDDERGLDEAGADWMSEQGFDRNE